MRDSFIPAAKRCVGQSQSDKETVLPPVVGNSEDLMALTSFLGELCDESEALLARSALSTGEGTLTSAATTAG